MKIFISIFSLIVINILAPFLWVPAIVSSNLNFNIIIMIAIMTFMLTILFDMWMGRYLYLILLNKWVRNKIK